MVYLQPSNRRFAGDFTGTEHIHTEIYVYIGRYILHKVNQDIKFQIMNRKHKLFQAKV